MSKTLSQHGLSARYVAAVFLFFAVYFALLLAFSWFHLLSIPMFIILNIINVGVFLWFVWARVRPVNDKTKSEEVPNGQ